MFPVSYLCLQCKLPVYSVNYLVSLLITTRANQVGEYIAGRYRIYGLFLFEVDVRKAEEKPASFLGFILQSWRKTSLIID